MRQKTLVILIILLITIKSWGQETANNFLLDERGIRWQKVFETHLTFKELAEKLKATGIFEKIDIGDNKIFGDTKSIYVNYQAAGFNYLETQNFISEYYYQGFIFIEYKEGKYRVTIKNIQLTSKSFDSKGKAEITNLEHYALKNGKSEMTDSFKKSASQILDYTFTKKTEINNNSDQDDW